MPRNAPQPGGATNDRPLDATLAETGPGLPDEAIGPGQSGIPEQNELADAEGVERMEQKLRAEAEARSRRRR